MKKQRTRKISWAVCAAVFIGLGTLLQAHAQTTSKDAVAEDVDYYIEWIIPETPPYPPVFQDGKWMTWEEAFGPLPKPEPIAVKVPKNPKPPEPYDSQKRWLGIKQRLAPQLFSDGKLKPEAETMFAKAKETALAKVKEKKALLPPKVDALNPRLLSQNHSTQSIQRGGSEGGNGPLDSGSPRLELVQADSLSLPGWTIVDLWLIDGPQGEMWEIFHAPILKSTAWRPIYVGAAHYAFDNIQGFTFFFEGQPPEGYFTAFLQQDSDFDGISDGYEVMLFKTAPTNPDSNSTRDADENGQPDYTNLGANEIADGDEDFDSDGLSNLHELQLGTDPFVAQNSAVDSDSDGLPDWLEDLITYYTGDPAPAPAGDSDGDGINNITEWQLGTDPSWGFEWIWASFASLPDHNRVVEHRNIEFSPASQMLMGFGPEENDPPVPADAYFDASFAGYHGTAAQLSVLKDTDAEGNYAPGVDTFKWAAAYQTPPNFVPAQNIPAPNPADGDIDNRAILRQATTMLGNVWSAAKVNEKLDIISEESLIHIQHRSFQRKWMRFRQLQLMMVAQEMPQGILLRVKPIIAEIHTESTILRKTTLTIGQRFPGTQTLARMGRFVPVAGSMCSVLSLANDANSLVFAYAEYMRDVKRHCDNNSESALFLAVALSNVSDVAFPAPVWSAFLYPYWWEAFTNLTATTRRVGSDG
jgi:hypothetical protein